MSFTTQPIGHQPRFGAVALRVNKTANRGLPHVTAYVGDYNSRGYGDGDIVVVSPSNTVHTLVSNNRLVNTYTQTLRTEGAFNPAVQGPHGNRVHRLARPVFKELKAMFKHGELPMSGTTDGNALYNRLFEMDRPEGTYSVERLLTEALGFHFLSHNESDPEWNDRHIFIDLKEHAFNRPPGQSSEATNTEAPPTESEPK